MLKHLMAMDELLASKLLFSVDLSIQRWLDQCRSANDREMEVDDNLVNFFQLVNQTLNQQLSVILPPSFEMKVIAAGDSNGEDEDDGKRKRKRNPNGGADEKSINEDPEED